MTITSKPPGRGALFGGKTMILFGGYDREAMRRWQERVRAAKDDPAEKSDESRLEGGPNRDKAAE